MSTEQIDDICLTWCNFITFISEELGFSYTLLIDKSDQDSLSKPLLDELLKSNYVIDFLDDVIHHPDLNQDFVFISGAQELSRKLLQRFNYFYIKPDKIPHCIHADLYWSAFYKSDWLDTVKEKNRFDCVDSISLDIIANKITVISPIVNDDVSLTGFFENVTQWSFYNKCDHLLIQETGNLSDSELLIHHIEQYPNAVYINLVNKLGLYEIWNQGAQLSTTPYLTNANVGDRRSPDQLVRLVEYLEGNPAIALVSTNLYVTSNTNQLWENSEDSPVVFESIIQEYYTTGQMFRADGKQLASHNLPHCMPVWRRDLHYQAGWFREQRYDSSADWELWLRAGIQGARYAYIAEPLGLYLKHENSYWRRSKTQKFDQRIVDEYAQLARNAVVIDRHSIPFSQRIHETRLAYDRQDALGFFCALSDSFLSMSKPEPTITERKIIDLVVKKTLGVNDFSHFLRTHYAAFFAVSDPIENALTIVIELLQSEQWASIKTTNQRAYKWLEAFFIDHFVLTKAVVSLIGLAYIKRLCENSKAEDQLLKAAYKQDADQCWVAIARIYRFRVKLDVLTAKLTHLTTYSTVETSSANVDKHKKLAIWFYPIAASNKYQRLLYFDCVAQGAQVTGIVNVQQFAQLRYDPQQQAIIHIHWIGEFVTGNDGFPVAKGQQFLQQLQQLQADGFQIYWTIHNALSHDSRYRQEEIRFRQALYKLVDRVYIHHPMILTQLAWLPDHGSKCALLEHGHYLSLFSSDISQRDARIQLGFDQNDMVVFYFGLLRDYKGLDAYLTVFEKVSQRYPHCKLIIAGQVHSKRVQQMLDVLQCPNIIVYNRFFSDEELEVYSRAASIGFLSYRSILTSGTLFHMLSAGLPVIAPAKGTLPAYIAQGWNGFSYETATDLEKILLHCCQLSPDLMATMGDNARQLANSLEWQFY